MGKEVVVRNTQETHYGLPTCFTRLCLVVCAKTHLGRKTLGRSSADTPELKRLAQRYGIHSPGAQLRRRLSRTILNHHARMRSQGTRYPEIDIRAIWRELFPFLGQSQLESLSIEYEMITNPVFPMPHLSHVLEICQRHGLAMGLVSNAQFYTRKMFHWFLEGDPAGLGFDADLVFLSYQWGQAKPSPFMFQRICARLKARGIYPAEALYIGNDMLNDIKPAREVGFQTALFAGDRRSLRVHGMPVNQWRTAVDLVITDLIQVITLLQ